MKQTKLAVELLAQGDEVVVWDRESFYTWTRLRIFDNYFLHCRRKKGLFSRAGEPEPGVFGSLEREPAPLEKKRSRSRLEKKVRSRSR